MSMRLWICLILPLLFAGGCVRQSVVLLPQQDGTVGKVVVDTPEGEQVVDEAYEVAKVTRGFDPEPLELGDATLVSEEYADLLAAEPEAPETFHLYFDTGQAVLKPAERVKLEQIRDKAEQRVHVNYAVVGHTDRVGGAAVNARLAEARAVRVARWLSETGVPRDQIEVDSHGENNPLVPTADGVAEAKNRRVDITIR